jgi:hypothetical protein
VKAPEQQPMQGLPPGFGAPGGQQPQQAPPAQGQPKEQPKSPPNPH